MPATRKEHLDWCKARALEYLDHGDVANAIGSMTSDMRKHPETEGASETIQGPLLMLAVMAAKSGDVEEARRFIEGFN